MFKNAQNLRGEFGCLWRVGDFSEGYVSVEVAHKAVRWTFEADGGTCVKVMVWLRGLCD
jgi:hypothetical protein